MLRVLSIFFSLLLLTGVSAQERPTITIGVNEYDRGLESRPLLDATREALIANFPDYDVKVMRLVPDQLRKAIETGQVDMFVASSGFYRQLTNTGAKDLATVIPVDATDPNLSHGSLLLVRSDNHELKSLQDLKGGKVVYSPLYGYGGLYPVLGEIAKFDSSPHDYLKLTKVESIEVPDLIKKLDKKEVDAVILPSCMLEKASKATGMDTSWLRVLNPKQHSALLCLHSTDLYPKLTFVTLPSTDPEVSRQASAVLTSMPPVNGVSWGIATNFKRVDSLLRRLDMDPDAESRKWSWKRMWQEYKSWFIAAMLFIVFLVAHSIRASFLVNSKTRQLREALDVQKELHSQAKLASKRIENLQKLSVMGQMSSLFAHEMRQPLQAIICYAYSLTKRNQKQSEDQVILDGLQEIRNQAERADEIVKRIRDYVKSRSGAFARVDLKDVIEKGIREFETTSTTKLMMEIRKDFIAEDCFVKGDVLELELVIINILRNAAEAQTSKTDARALIKLRKEGSQYVVSIIDNGDPVTDETLAHLNDLLHSSKPEGLGLGVSIVRMLLENHFGSLSFEANHPNGLVAIIRLPQFES